MPKIKQIKAREILDSRGNPTLEVEVVLSKGLKGVASVPSGASTGVHEAWELRDGGDRYRGWGVLKAVRNVNLNINKSLKGVDVLKQETIDKKLIKLDGTRNKKRLGANAIVGVSLACARAGALAKKLSLYRYLAQTFKFPVRRFSLPVPLFNIFNGGKHADTNLDFQEFWVVPQGVKGKKPFSKMLQAGAEIFHELGVVLKERGFDTDVGNEGGYAPDIYSSVQALDMIMAAIIRSGYKPGEEVFLGMDVGSSVLYDRKTKKYIFRLDRAVFDSLTLIGLYEEWLRKYPFLLLEDGLAEDDWEGWKELTESLGDNLVLIGDDLFVTNKRRLRNGIKLGVANAVLIKPNQVGTLTETMETIKLAKKNGYKVVISHRSGETNDDFIADLAVGVEAEYIKAGAPNRGERVAKYNRLLRIEEELGG